MQYPQLRLTRLAPIAVVALVLTAPTCAKDTPKNTSTTATREAAVTTVNYETCAVAGNKGETTVIDWEPGTASKQPVEVRWETTGKPQGYTVQIKALTGTGEQSPDAEQQAKILAMFELKYEIGKDGQTVLSGLPTNPPFGTEKEVRWKYQVQVLDAAGKVVCGKDPDVCLRQPGGCEG